MVILAVILPTDVSFCATIYTDNRIPADCPGTYDSASRSCGRGLEIGYRTLKGAADAAKVGDTVLLRAGAYVEPLVPARSGNPGQFITYTNFPGEAVVIGGVDGPAISLSSKEYLVIDNLAVTDSLGWGRVEASKHIIIRNVRFARAKAHGTTGGLKFVKSSFNKVLNSRFDAGNDSLVLQESDRNLVQGNGFNGARHSLLSIRCGSFNVIRGNRFHNTDQKAAEIYDCEGTSDAPVKLDATKRNLFENNEFSHTKASSRDYRYNGIQFSGQGGIVRKNVFYDNQGGALNFQVYSKESLYNNRNHVYNNTFYNNRCYGLVASNAGDPGRYYGNIVKNNIFYRNADCGGGDGQTAVGNSRAVKFESNAVVKASPMFENEAARNLRLASGSPMIDAGSFATRTAGQGAGTVMAVEDAGYFYDGFGIPGESGDAVRLEGQSATARIAEIDYEKNLLKLDRPLSWNGRQNLHIEYFGVRPDMGAYEQGSSETKPR